MAAPLLIDVSAAGASSVDVEFDTLRRWLLDGLIPVVVVAGQNMARSIDVGISLRTAASELGVPVDTVVSLVRAGDLKPLPLPGATRLRKADIEAWVRKLTSLPMTDELRETIWPAVEEFRPPASDDYRPNPMGSRDLAEARNAAASRLVELEFQSTLPKPIVTVDANGVETVEGLLDANDVKIRRQFFHQQRQQAAEAKRLDLASRR